MKRLGWDLIDRNMAWVIFVCIIQGRFWRLKKAMEYLNVRLNREIYLQQLRHWELERRLAAIKKRLQETN